MAPQKFDKFRYLKSQVAYPGEINNDDNLPRTFSRFLDNQLDRRERSRSHLWQNRNSTRAQDSLDRVSVVSPSLVESLLQCSSENRIMPYCTFLEYKDDARLEDKMQFDWFVRVAPASENATVYTCHHYEVAQKFAPQLRSITFRQDEYDEIYDVQADIPKMPFNAKLREFVISELQSDDGFLAIISLNGSQLESLVLVDFEFFSACASLSDTRIPMMPRLKKLKLGIFSIVYSEHKPIQMGPHLERVIPWSQLTIFSVQFYLVELDDIYQCGILLDLFGQMAQLHRLSFSLSYDIYIYDRLHVNEDRLNELCTFMLSKTNQIQEFTNLEIFSFYAHFHKNNQHEEVAKMYPDYRFFLNQFSPKLGTKLRKLIFKLPGDLASTDHCLAIDFSQPFCQLETLVLNFAALFGKTPELNQLRGFINNQDDGPIRSKTIRQLAIKNLECYYPLLLNQIPDVFPNLVELKIGFVLSRSRFLPNVPQFPDQDLMQIIDRLPQLRSFRFTDNIAKAKDLYGSIDLMCKRAMDLKPRNPMQFRIPLDAEFLLKFNQLPDTEKAELCWIKAAKWIQVY